MTTTPEQSTDEQLMVQVQHGCQAALTSLYERYVRIVYGMALQKLAEPAEAEDLTHDVFVNLWLRAGTFHPERGKVRSWLLTVAHNQIIDRLRRRQRSEHVLDAVFVAAAFAVDSSPETTESLVIQREEVGQVRRALQALPEEQRQVIVLSYYQGYSQSYIANRLQIPLGTVKSRMRLALTRLRTELNPGGVKQ